MKTLNAILIAAALGAGAALAADTARVDAGVVKGSASGGVAAFKGIPFAAPPTGENRWRAPQPVQPWSGVREATAYAHDCAQKPFPGDAAPLGTPPAEDCLYLNVWTPAKHAGATLPVMVWIYGGGFVNGGSSPAVYAGTHFAERGVVFVSFNYRVGRFGFFAHPALTAENPDGPLGNYAFLDQIAALEWVRRNIAKFGGDPHNVTIFGESAGGMSVLTLMTSPMSQGLFQKAIVESGGGRTLMGNRRLHESSPGQPSAEEVGIAFAKKNGIEGTDAAALAKLRALPEEKVVDGLNMMGMGNPTYAGPMIDGRIVTGTLEEAIASGRVAKVPVIIGANSNDIGFSFARNMDELLTRFGDKAEVARATYDPDKSNNFHAVGTVMAADQMMIEPARHVARVMTAAGEPAYEYRFSYVADSMRKQWKGAPHATEIPFVFDTVADRYGDKLTPADEAAAKFAIAYWVAFAKTGDPNGEGRPAWPRYDPKQDMLLDFTATGPVPTADPWKPRLDLTEYAAEMPKQAATAARQAAAPQAPPVVSPEVTADHRVIFRILAPLAKSVALNASDIPGWKRDNPTFTKGDNGVWEAAMGPVDPGAYRYTFVVDGVMTMDPHNPSVSESNANAWSMVYVPGAGFMDTNKVPHGAVASITYYSKALERPRRMHIYTPPGYENGTEKYPVFYLLHGAMDCDDSWTSVGRAGFIMDNLIAEHKAKPMVIVMPAGHTSTVFRMPQPARPRRVRRGFRAGHHALRGVALPRADRSRASRHGRAFHGWRPDAEYRLRPSR